VLRTFARTPVGGQQTTPAAGSWPARSRSRRGGGGWVRRCALRL